MREPSLELAAARESEYADSTDERASSYAGFGVPATAIEPLEYCALARLMASSY